MMLNVKNSMADRLGLKVEYKGVNGMKQHLFASGGPLINHVFNSLEEAVARFGDRIELHEKQYKLSGPFRMGHEATKYAPRSEAKHQELVEYGLGFVKRLTESEKKVAPVAVKTPAPVESKTPIQPTQAAPLRRGPGRPPKSTINMGALRQQVLKPQ